MCTKVSSAFSLPKLRRNPSSFHISQRQPIRIKCPPHLRNRHAGCSNPRIPSDTSHPSTSHSRHSTPLHEPAHAHPQSSSARRILNNTPCLAGTFCARILTTFTAFIYRVCTKMYLNNIDSAAPTPATTSSAPTTAPPRPPNQNQKQNPLTAGTGTRVLMRASLRTRERMGVRVRMGMVGACILGEVVEEEEGMA